MQKNIPPLDLKQLNRNNIFRAIWQEKRITKQGLIQQLGLSLPTVTQNLIELCDEGLVEENGTFGHTGGRRAKGYSVAPRARLAVGVDVNKTHIAVVVVDLYGEVVCSLHEHRHFAPTTEYYGRVGELTQQMMDEAGVTQANLLGVGVSVQGLVSHDKTTVTYGPILGTTGETVQTIAQFIPYTAQLFHDASAAAFAELWVSPELRNAVYLSLSTNLGGSLIVDRGVFGGDNFAAGKVEHMTLYPGGEACYCGKQGCAEVYCSVSRLTANITDGRLGAFFEKLEAGEEKAAASWSTYLDNLAILINSLHMLLDTEVVLGGYMTPYLAKYLPDIKQRVYARNSVDPGTDYIKLGRFENEAIAAGAALYYVDEFIRSV